MYHTCMIHLYICIYIYYIYMYIHIYTYVIYILYALQCAAYIYIYAAQCKVYNPVLGEGLRLDRIQMCSGVGTEVNGVLLLFCMKLSIMAVSIDVLSLASPKLLFLGLNF